MESLVVRRKTTSVLKEVFHRSLTPHDGKQVDAEYEGTVKSVTDFGVFVDLGMGSDGMVHKSQLSDDFVANPADLGLEKGQKVRKKGANFKL